VPLAPLRLCQQALRGAPVVAGAGNRNASSDTGVAVELLMAAIRGASLNVDVNVKSLTDAAFAGRTAEERTELETEAAADAARARARLAAS
jgi:formiminotetrahydrofolate cyclodeaminase